MRQRQTDICQPKVILKLCQTRSLPCHANPHFWMHSWYGRYMQHGCVGASWAVFHCYVVTELALQRAQPARARSR